MRAGSGLRVAVDAPSPKDESMAAGAEQVTVEPQAARPAPAFFQEPPIPIRFTPSAEDPQGLQALAAVHGARASIARHVESARNRAERTLRIDTHDLHVLRQYLEGLERAIAAERERFHGELGRAGTDLHLLRGELENAVARGDELEREGNRKIALLNRTMEACNRLRRLLLDRPRWRVWRWAAWRRDVRAALA